MNRITKALTVALLLSTLLLFAGNAWAGTYTAADCSLNSVNAVINGPTHTAVNGDIIQIPAGSCTWTSPVIVPAGIGITVTGTGTPQSTSSTTGASATCSQTVITASTSHIIEFRPNTTSALSRISCMKVLGSGSTGGAPLTAGGTCNASGCPSFRVDNVTFDGSLQGHAGDSGAQIGVDNVFGVLDHNSMAGSSQAMFQFVTYHESAWKGVGDWGDNSRSSPDSFGTAQAIYVENNSFGSGVWVSETEAQVPFGNEGGGRIAVRFNTCNGCQVGLANHGTDSNGRPRGPLQGEFYGNNFTCTDTSGGCQGGVAVRSGTYMMFGNSLIKGAGSWLNSYLVLNTYRISVIWGAPWNQCLGLYDQSSPLVCTDEPSRSGGTLLSGNPPTPTGWTNQVVDPTYEWDDVGGTWTIAQVSQSNSNLTANSDYYTDNSNGANKIQTSPTSPFNGSSGVGFGTLANRPSSCTLNSASGSAGVGYWVTGQGSWNKSGNSFGQGQFYTCRDAAHQLDVNGQGTTCTQAQDSNHFWCLYYTPYTYPHPLVTGTVTGTAPNPPTGLQTSIVQ